MHISNLFCNFAAVFELGEFCIRDEPNIIVKKVYMNALEELLEYLNTASSEQLAADFEELREFTLVGPCMDSLFGDMDISLMRCESVPTNQDVIIYNNLNINYAMAA